MNTYKTTKQRLIERIQTGDGDVFIGKVKATCYFCGRRINKKPIVLKEDREILGKPSTSFYFIDLGCFREALCKFPSAN